MEVSLLLCATTCILLVGDLAPSALACNSMYRMPSSAQRRNAPSRSLRTLLVLKERVPSGVSELSSAASGVARGPILNGTRAFAKLETSWNADIVFRDEESTGEDRIMTQRCKDKLDRLALMVRNYWDGSVRLRVTEAWDAKMASGTGKNGAEVPLTTNDHASDSLHFEGRAVDIMTSDRDRSKLGMLGRLAYNAGFDHVYYQARNHIHCSVKSDEVVTTSTGGCFHGDSLVQVLGQGPTRMRNLRLGDEVLAVSSGTLRYDKVYMFMDRQPTAKSKFVTIEVESGQRLRLTRTHLVFVHNPSKSAPVNNSKVDAFSLEHMSVKFAEDISDGDFLYTYGRPTEIALARPGDLNGLRGYLRRVQKVSISHDLGYFAPITTGGTIVVDNVLTSCYAHVPSHNLAHRALVPARLFDTIASLSQKLVSQLPMYWSTEVHHQSNSGIIDSMAWADLSTVGLGTKSPSEVTYQDGVHWYGKMLLQLFAYVPAEIIALLSM